tara:strand:+ start:253 stop:1104 length:852 start_codon:yes stop_codon:yes gene_type:complete
VVSGKTLLLAVLGNPITHSLSPIIHNAMLDKLELDFKYIPLALKETSIQSDFTVLKKTNFKGFNVTVPFKESILPYLDEFDENVKKIGASNTILQKENKWIGFNTDLKGFLYSLENFSSYNLNSKKVVCIGAGGSAKAVCFALLEKSIKALTIVNRSEGRLKELIDSVDIYNKSQIDISGLLFSDTSLYTKLADADLVINTTPIGMSSHSDLSLLDDYNWVNDHHFCYDLIYSPKKTRFLEKAEEKGARIQNGLAMLVAQAAYSFEIFTGNKADFDFMYSKVS